MNAGHAIRALKAIVWREITKFARQTGRLISALVRPGLWLLVFAAGFQNVFGVSIIPPYDTYITYQEYVIPGLIGMVLLFNGMISSLSMVYDREMGVMRLLLTAPLPRWYVLFCKILAAALLSVVQAYVFLLVAALVGVRIPWWGWLYALPAIACAAMMLGALGMALAVYVRQLENFAGAMNFVIFPMFFISSALYPLWTLKENGGELLYYAALCNPFTRAVELIRFSAYGRFDLVDIVFSCSATAALFILATVGFDPQIAMFKSRLQAG